MTQFAEPQFAEPQFAEPQFAEPQFAEPQFAEPPVLHAIIRLGRARYDRTEFASTLGMAHDQLGFFDAPAAPRFPEGFRYAEELIGAAEEAALLAKIEMLPLKEFEFHGYTGKRRTTSFGWHYDFASERLREAEPFPPFLLPLRDRAATFAGLEPAQLAHVLVTEYREGAGIGWHRDKGVFDDVIGVSLLSPCTFRLRRKSGARWERVNLVAAPRSVYLLRGPSRTEWEHSIPGVEGLRYSITFRALKAARG